jgi:predicted AlkP superfamily phosphohydrolase/phosphomutase
MIMSMRFRGTLALAAALLLAGCGGGGGTTADRGTEAAPKAAPKLLVIGIDSADWRLLDPMMAAGRLPHLKAFRAQAASGRMESFYPLEKSPLLWASICTGVEPAVHGIDNFVRGSDQKPVTGSSWHAPAIWDIIGAAGRSTLVIGMWTTFPAREINGVMVSDYLPYGRDREKPLVGLVYPDSLAATVVACRVDPLALGNEQLARFLPAGADVAALEQAYPQQMTKLREIWAADLGYLEVARRLKDQRAFDLFFFYLRGPDMISHGFYHYRVADPAGWHGDQAELAAFSGVVEHYYEWVDEATGEVLSWFPGDHPTVIASDHGFYGPRPDGKGTVEHSEWGIFMVRSPLHTAGATFGHLKLLDICPTMLALLDLPPARDMPGAVLAEGLTAKGQDRVAHIEKSRVPSYLALRPAVGNGVVEADDKVEEEIRRQLRSLGYIK